MYNACVYIKYIYGYIVYLLDILIYFTVCIMVVWKYLLVKAIIIKYRNQSIMWLKWFTNQSAGWFLCGNRLVIFPLSGNNTFGRSDFADLRFSLWNSEGVSHSPTVFMEKIIAKRETNAFVFSIQRVCLFPPFYCRKIKEQIAERRNLLDIKFWRYCIYEASLYNCFRHSEIPWISKLVHTFEVEKLTLPSTYFRLSVTKPPWHNSRIERAQN